MIARQYSRKIQIYTTGSILDGYGGLLVEDVLIGSFWAEVKQNSSYKDNANGVSDIKGNYSFKIRANANVTPDMSDLSIVYKTKKYAVNDIRYDDELFRFINITANGGVSFTESGNTTPVDPVEPVIPFVNDGNPPTTPYNLAASNIQATQFMITFTGSTVNGGVLGANIERYEFYKNGVYYIYDFGNSAGRLIQLIPSGTTNLWKMRAKDASGVYSAFSNEISVTQL